MSKDLKIVAFILWITIVVLCSLILRNTEAVDEGNNISKRQEYQRVLLGCNSAGAIESDDPDLRELCDETFLKISEEYGGD